MTYKVDRVLKASCLLVYCCVSVLLSLSLSLCVCVCVCVCVYVCVVYDRRGKVSNVCLDPSLSESQLQQGCTAQLTVEFPALAEFHSYILLLLSIPFLNVFKIWY